MAERAKDPGPEWNGPRTGPITSLSEALKSLPGDQFHLLSQPNSDPPSVSTSSRDTDLGEPEKLMALFSEYDNLDDAKEHWEADRYQPKKGFIATRIMLIGLVGVMCAIAIAVPLVFFKNNKRLADATPPPIVAPKQAATESAPARAKSAETSLAAAEQSRPRDPAIAQNPAPTSGDSAADTKSVAQDQTVSPQAPTVTQVPPPTAEKEELANAPVPAAPKSMDQGQNVSPQAPAVAQSPATTVDNTAPSPDQFAADAKSLVQSQNPPPQAPTEPQSATKSVDKEEVATSPSPDQNVADAKSVVQAQAAPMQEPAASQAPTGTIDKQKLAAVPPPDRTAAEPKSVTENQNAAPQAPAAVPTQQRTIDKEQLDALLKRGRYLLSVGDIASARLLLERAAAAPDAGAAFDLAGTYDPVVLYRARVFGIAPDVAMARMWYEKALSLGYSEAQARLTQLQK